MRLVIVTAVLAGVAAAASGCAQIYDPSVSGPLLARVDPQDAAERALIGGVLGAALGTGLGATFAINPAIGAVVGVEAGAGFGAAIGAITAQPIPDYKPIPPAAAASITPGFYDTWPPGYHSPPVTAGVPPPPG